MELQRLTTNVVFFSIFLLSLACSAVTDEVEGEGRFRRQQTSNTLNPAMRDALSKLPNVACRGSVCINYNPREVATSLEEAIMNFKDMTNPDPSKATTVTGDQVSQMFPGVTVAPTGGGSNFGQSLACKTDQCKRCATWLLSNLSSQNLAKGSSGKISSSDIQKALIALGANSRLLTGGVPQSGDCKNIAQSTAAAETLLSFLQVDSKPQGQDAASECIKKVVEQSNGGSEQQMTFPDVVSRALTGSQRNEDDRILWHGIFHGRKRRQASGDFQAYYDIKCIQKGNPVADGSPMVGMCDMCWQYGMLSNDYWPQYVNLMSCGTNTRCLGGYGQCQQRYRSVTVMKNVNGVWQTWSLNTPTCCDCQVISSSALYNFIRS